MFSWTHTLHKCMGKDGEGYRLERSCFDEEWYPVPLSRSEDTLLLSNRKLSTYVNGLSKAGFLLEKLVEQTDKELLPTEGEENELARRAELFPVTFVMKARKL